MFPYSSTLAAVAKKKDWQSALSLFEEMGRKGVERDTITHSATISACEKGRQLDRCVALYGEACSQGLYDHSLPSRCGGIFLYGFCFVVSKTAIVLHLSKSGSCSGRQERDLAIVTGRGNHVLADGRRGVLRAEMELFLSEQLGLTVQTVEGNDGMLIVRAANVRRFLQTGRPGDGDLAR